MFLMPFWLVHMQYAAYYCTLIVVLFHTTTSLTCHLFFKLFVLLIAFLCWQMLIEFHLRSRRGHHLRSNIQRKEPPRSWNNSRERNRRIIQNYKQQNMSSYNQTRRPQRTPQKTGIYCNFCTHLRKQRKKTKHQGRMLPRARKLTYLLLWSRSPQGCIHGDANPLLY